MQWHRSDARHLLHSPWELMTRRQDLPSDNQGRTSASATSTAGAPDPTTRWQAAKWRYDVLPPTAQFDIHPPVHQQSSKQTPADMRFAMLAAFVLLASSLVADASRNLIVQRDSAQSPPPDAEARRSRCYRLSLQMSLCQYTGTDPFLPAGTCCLATVGKVATCSSYRIITGMSDLLQQMNCDLSALCLSVKHQHMQTFPYTMLLPMTDEHLWWCRLALLT